MIGDRWEIVSEWLGEWLAADANRREHLRARLAAAHPELLPEAEDLARAAGAITGFLDTPALVLEASALAAGDRLLPAGTEIGPYRIVSLVGRGGTGDVYRATDVRLGRDVALKVLAQDRTSDPRHLERFFREARITASLDHPHIGRVYDVGHGGGHAYLAAELLEGQTLRGRISQGAMPVDEALRIGIEIAGALAAAHAAGLVHRDLKPDNIFLTSSGATKVLDFGIAKLAPDDAAPDGPLTMTGVVLGTAGYLAPEQIRNSSVDARADLFALGVLLFEMLTGARAFERDHLVETLHAILHDPPSDALRTRDDVPSEVVSVLTCLLEKSPDARFQSAEDVIGALQRARAAAHGKPPAGRKTARARLGVLARPTFLVALIVAVTAGAAVMTWLRSSAPPVASTRTVPRVPSEEAQEKVRLGRAAARRIEPENLRTAEKYFKEAISLEPEYAEAWAGLASAYKRFPITGAGPANIYMPRARDAAQRALTIDANNVDAISALGWIANSDWKDEEAEGLLKRALTIDGNHSDSHLVLANIYLNRGQFDNALSEIRRAQLADQQWPQLRALEGEMLIIARRYKEALHYLDDASKIDPNSWTTLTYRATALRKLGRTKEALSATTARSSSRRTRCHSWAAVWALAQLNRRKEAAAVLAKLPPDDYLRRATLLHALGHNDEAIAALNAAVDSHSANVMSLGVHPLWDDLRDRESFRDVVRRINRLSVSDRFRRGSRTTPPSASSASDKRR